MGSNNGEHERVLKSTLAETIPSIGVEPKKLLDKTELLKTRNNVIILDPNNPDHVDWYGDDGNDPSD